MSIEVGVVADEVNAVVMAGFVGLFNSRELDLLPLLVLLDALGLTHVVSPHFG